MACVALTHRPGVSQRQARSGAVLGATMSDTKPPASEPDSVVVENLKLAAWLRLNGAKLLYVRMHVYP